MRMLQAATRNIAKAYGKDRDLGTLEVGKFADILLLDENPLLAAKNYLGIHCVIKAGEVVNRDELPKRPMLSRPPDPATEAEASYVPFLQTNRTPTFPCCTRR